MKKPNKKVMVSNPLLNRLPFSIDKRPLDHKVKINENFGVWYRSPDVIGEFEAKVLLVLAKACLDDEEFKAHPDESPWFDMIQIGEKHTQAFWYISIDLGKFAQYMDTQGRNRRIMRMRIYEALVKLAEVNIKVYRNMKTEGDFKLVSKLQRWVHSVWVDYDEKHNPLEKHPLDVVQLSVSYELLKSMIPSEERKEAGVQPKVINMDKLLTLKGRTSFGYIYLQGQKYMYDKNKFAYNDYINHNDFAEALQVDKMEVKEQNKMIKKVFNEIGLDYKKVRLKTGHFSWKKQYKK